MTGNVFAKARNLAIRGVAVAAVVVTYALSSVGTHVLSMAGVSTLALTTTSTPAQAWWVRRRAWYPRRRWRRRRWW